MNRRRRAKNVVEVVCRPNADAIRSVRSICAQVERGDIMSVGFVLVKRGGNVSTGWDTAPGDTHKMISGAAVLQYRITAAAEDGAE
jgi:hypothetical protein